MSRPALGKIAEGDEVFVWPRKYGRGGPNEPVAANVTKVARVWIELIEGQPHLGGVHRREWRMRRDTQNEGQGHYSARFVTADQLAYDKRVSEADRVLREQGIDLRRESPWSAPEERVRLADLLRTAIGSYPSPTSGEDAR
ncbi:MAG TPA: hypothetical protein VFX60_19190 [Micromonospora sp.]|nr:hypothetical protein [Micromonospora sp.]